VSDTRRKHGEEPPVESGFDPLVQFVPGMKVTVQGVEMLVIKRVKNKLTLRLRRKENT
jgi:hypothetical protein